MLTLSTKFAQLCKPDVFGHWIRSSQDVLPVFRLNGKDILLVSNFCIGADANELGKINDGLFSFLGYIFVIGELECGRIIL